MDLTAALDPNIAALLGGGGGTDQFTKMLLQSINPNAAKDLTNQLGPPDLAPLNNIANNPPPIRTASSAPVLPGPQTLQAMGFGMAAAAGKPGSSALSALGEGGNSMLAQGATASDRAIREAQAENSAALAQWEGKGRIADEVLNAQLKGPELDQHMMDLTGQSLLRSDQAKDNAAYRAGLLESAGAKNVVAQQNADTAGTRAATGQQRANTYDQKVGGDQDLKAQALQLQQQKIDQAGAQFQQRLLQTTKTQGQRIGLDTAAKAAQEFKNEMTLRKNPITGDLPDEATQEALRQSIAEKYNAATAPPAAAPAPAEKAPPDATLAQAKAAIAAGADPTAVAARLQSMGIDPKGLNL